VNSDYLGQSKGAKKSIHYLVW